MNRSVMAKHMLNHKHADEPHGNTHEILEGPGSFLHRTMPITDGRDFKERAFTVGIGGLRKHRINAGLVFCVKSIA